MADIKAVAITKPKGRLDNLHLLSVNRVVKLPVVESTINIASGIYDKVKDYSSVTNCVLSKAESTVHYAVDAVQPVTTSGPVQKVDSFLCSSLDYIESNVPAIMLPPEQMYTNTKLLVCSKVQPAIKCVCAMRDYGAQKVAHLYNGLTQAKPCEAGPLCYQVRQPCSHSPSNSSAKIHDPEEDFKECGHCEELSKGKQSGPSSPISIYFSPKSIKGLKEIIE